VRLVCLSIRVKPVGNGNAVGLSGGPEKSGPFLFDKHKFRLYY